MGIVTHSQPGRNYLIFSVFQASKHNFINLAAHKEAKKLLNSHGVSYNEIVGSYKGEIERSLLVPNNGENLALVKKLCQINNQECFLKLDNHKHGTMKAYFVDKHDKETFQGYFRSMDKETIDRKQLDFSYNIKNPNTLFTIWPSDTTTLDDLEKEKA